jgi:hypothetical protein
MLSVMIFERWQAQQSCKSAAERGVHFNVTRVIVL